MDKNVENGVDIALSSLNVDSLSLNGEMTRNIDILPKTDLNSFTLNGDAQNDKLLKSSAKDSFKNEDPYVDPFSDPNHPLKVYYSNISAAALNIRDGIVHTPTLHLINAKFQKSIQLSEMFGLDLYLKKEYLQVTGSFKERGACYALVKLTSEEKKAGVIAASAGNHALALAYHGQQLGIPVTVVMPNFAPLMKISNCKGYGALVILHGSNIEESKEYSYKLSRANGMKYINGYDNPDVIAGQGTIGLEILEQVKHIDAIIVPIGGGGLIAGVSLAVKTMKPEIQIIGVESEACPSFQKVFYDRQCSLHPDNTLADGLAVPTVGTNALLNSRGLIDNIISVSEESIALAILRLIEIEKSVVEGAGAVGLAALLSGKLNHLKGKRVVNILTGGNIDTTVLGRTIERGLAVDGRLIKFDIVVSDRPGGIAELTTEISKYGASIKDIFHERAWLADNIFSVRVRVVAETRNASHAKELLNRLSLKYKQVFY